MALLMFAPASCGGAGSSSPPLAPAPSSAPVATTSSALTTTTTATTAPPTTEDAEVAAVRRAHLDYLAMFEVVGDPPDPDHPELARVATGDAYDRLRANLALDKLRGNRLVGGYESAIQGIVVAGNEAEVVDCSLDFGVVYGPDGSVVVPADSMRVLRTVRLRRVDGVWKAWRLDLPDPPIPCDA